MQPIFKSKGKQTRLFMLYTIITSTPIYVCSILSILLILSLCTRWDRPRYRLLLFMVTATALYAGHFVFFNRMTSAIPISDTLYCYSNPAVFPLFLIYIESLVLKNPNRKHEILYLVPALFCGISAGLLYAMMGEEETNEFIGYHIYGKQYSGLTGPALWLAIIHIIVKVIFTLEIPVILVMGWRYITNYNKMVRNSYSNTEDKVLSLIKPLLIAFVSASVISFISNFIGREYFSESVWLLAIPTFAFSALILLFGFVGLTQHYSINNLEEELDITDINSESAIELTQDAEDNLTKEIRRLMDEKQLFLQSNLKINDLALMLNTNRNYIYHAINGKIGVSFSDYINQKRIDYAVSLIESHPTMHLTEVAHKSGFSSPSSFYRNFKAIMGCSPSDYQKRRDANITVSIPHKNL